jgi:hypothetical protein
MPDDNNVPDDAQDDRGELVTRIGPLSIFRSAVPIQFTPDDGSDAQINVEHRYTVRVDTAWIDTGGVVAFEIEPPYFASETGKQLDDVGSIVEFVRDPEASDADARMSVLLADPATAGDNASNQLALSIRYK